MIAGIIKLHGKKRWCASDFYRGFTLVEVMVVVGIASLLIAGVFYAFGQNMDSWHRGEKKLVLQSEISTILSRVYYDIKRINPAIYYDVNSDIWVSGERFKEAKPNEIELIDENQDRTDGFERIRFKVYLINPFSKIENIEYCLKKDPNSVTTSYEKNKYGTANILIRIQDGVETVVSEHVETFKLKKEENKHSLLNLFVKVTMPPEYKIGNRTDFIDIKIKFDNDFVIMRETLSESH